MAVPELPPSGCTKTFSKWAEVFERPHHQRVQRQAAGHAQIASRASHADGGFLHGLLNAGGDVRPQSLRNGGAGIDPQALVEARTETAAVQPLRAEKATVDARPALADIENFEEQLFVAIVAGGGKPLHLVLIFVGRKTQQLGHAAIELAEGIGRVLFVFEGHARTVGLPARAATEAAAAVEREHDGLVEGRRVISGSGVGLVVVYHDDAARRKQRAQL